VVGASVLPVVPASAAGGQNARPAWWGYTRPATDQQVLTHIKLPMPDGALLQCDLSRPGASTRVDRPGRFSSVLADFTPYAIAIPAFDATDGAYFSQRGYVVLICAVRGSGTSTGTFRCCITPLEVGDGYHLIEWMARQTWSNGRVGMEGDSYGGMTAMAVAARRPPHLVTIVPQQFPDNLYLDAVYPGGIKATPFVRDNWPSYINGLSGGRINGAQVEATYLAHSTLDGFWRSIDTDTKYSAIKVPVLDINSGRPDIYFRGSLAPNDAALRSHGWVIVGPWEHSVWSGDSYQLLPIGTELAWFDHWLSRLPGAPLPATDACT
jgi:predicted acyl esterase